MLLKMDRKAKSALCLTITVTLENNSYYLCQLSNPLQDPSKNTISCYGQTQEHSIAIALEQLADQYRQIAEDQQNIDMLTVERSADGEAISKLYHVILHYECTIDAESKFEAMHDTIMGNTVVENGKITVIEVDKNLPIADILKLGWSNVYIQRSKANPCLPRRS
jgi:hypothetical protein